MISVFAVAGFLDFSEFYFMLKRYDPNCPLDGVKTSFKNAGQLLCYLALVVSCMPYLLCHEY